LSKWKEKDEVIEKERRGEKGAGGTIYKTSKSE